MLRRVLTLLTLVATVVLLGDVAQIVCFGEDGHVAIERLAGDEHVTPAASSGVRDATFDPMHALPERVHIDVSVADVGVKDRVSTPLAPATSVAHVALPVPHAAVFADLVLGVDAPSLGALRTIVLRV